MTKIVMTKNNSKLFQYLFLLQLQINLFKKSLGKTYFDCSSSLLKTFYNDSEREDFYLRHVSEEFVFKGHSQLNLYKSSGLDEIKAIFLKKGHLS